MKGLSTHVLDTSRGRPAEGVSILLEALTAGAWTEAGRGVTNADGRVPSLLPVGTALRTGYYRLTFDTGAYFVKTGVAGFYPRVTVEFEIADADQHYHVPLLLNPFGYSTYRGS
ncbi:MAG: hydroxyisourate hydrolase [Planctomycetes bacterium]|nr:hydroxyisourate hydrolase [Planctomycetota bacterium]